MFGFSLTDKNYAIVDLGDIERFADHPLPQLQGFDNQQLLYL